MREVYSKEIKETKELLSALEPNPLKRDQMAAQYVRIEEFMNNFKEGELSLEDERIVEIAGELPYGEISNMRLSTLRKSVPGIKQLIKRRFVDGNSMFFVALLRTIHGIPAAFKVFTQDGTPFIEGHVYLSPSFDGGLYATKSAIDCIPWNKDTRVIVTSGHDLSWKALECTPRDIPVMMACDFRGPQDFSSRPGNILFLHSALTDLRWPLSLPSDMTSKTKCMSIKDLKSIRPVISQWLDGKDKLPSAIEVAVKMIHSGVNGLNTVVDLMKAQGIESKGFPEIIKAVVESGVSSRTNPMSRNPSDFFTAPEGKRFYCRDGSFWVSESGGMKRVSNFIADGIFKNSSVDVTVRSGNDRTSFSIGKTSYWTPSKLMTRIKREVSDKDFFIEAWMRKDCATLLPEIIKFFSNLN